jgi:hypothetical protein
LVRSSLNKGCVVELLEVAIIDLGSSDLDSDPTIAKQVTLVDVKDVRDILIESYTGIERHSSLCSMALVESI